MSEYAPLAAGKGLAGSLTGQTVGRFLIQERLGKGGMGEVYKAEDTRLKRTVALKRLSPYLRSDPLYRRRFQEEAERASKLTDQHVAALYDVIEDDQEIFLVMEFVEGQTLRQRLGQPLALQEFLKIAIQCAEALIAAHERGIVHCDIKPENIMLTLAGRVKILDFGVAKHLPRADQSSTIDRSGTVGGTPAYMSPEVLLEKATDGRADIFSLGIVLYEALAGRHPFLCGSYVATTHRVLYESATPIHVFNPKVSEQLEHIVERAMAKEPGLRYANAQDLADDLKDVQAGVTPSKLLPVQKRSYRAPAPRLHWILGAIILVLLAGVSYLERAQIQRWVRGGEPVTVAQMHLAILPFTPSSNDPNSRAFSQGLTETLAVRLTQLTSSYPLQVVPPREITADAIQTAQQARRNFGVNVVLEGSVRESGNFVRISYSLVDTAKLSQLRADTITVEANKPFEIEDRVLQSIVGMLGLELGPQDKNALLVHGTQQPAAYDYYVRGRGYLQEYDKPENLESAITVLRHALESDPKYALAYAGLGEAYLHKYDRNREKKWVDLSLQSCQTAVSLAEPIPNGHVCLGQVYNKTGQYENAVREFQRAVDLDPTGDQGYIGLAYAYERLGKMTDVERIYLRAIQLRPQYWGGYAWLGTFYYRQARYDDAARMFTETIALAPDSYSGYSNLGAMYLFQGKYADAIPQFQRSVAIYPSPDAYSNLAIAYFFQGNFTEAARTYERALEVGPNDSSAYIVWGNLAEAYYWAPGERERAVPTYEKAIALAKERLRINTRDTDALYHLGLFYAGLKQKTLAEDYVQKALQEAPKDTEVQFSAAKAYVELGDMNQGMSLLQTAVAAGYSTAFVRDDPAFKVLASNVQFQRLLRNK